MDEKRERMLSPKEVASRLQIARETVYAWIESGELRALDLSATGSRPRWSVPESALEAFLDARSNAV